MESVFKKNTHTHNQKFLWPQTNVKSQSLFTRRQSIQEMSESSFLQWSYTYYFKTETSKIGLNLSQRIFFCLIFIHFSAFLICLEESDGPWERPQDRVPLCLSFTRHHESTEVPPPVAQGLPKDIMWYHCKVGVGTIVASGFKMVRYMVLTLSMLTTLFQLLKSTQRESNEKIF